MIVLKTFMAQTKPSFEQAMEQYLDSNQIPASLHEAMMYSLMIGGKRIRPMLLFAVLEAAHVTLEKGYKTAAALEMIHTYSLIHDDLPAMDDDDLRRGKPTNHKVYGEATAILAGDSLLTYAFELIATDEALPIQIRLELVTLLAKAAGPSGMVAGQVLDMAAETKRATLDELKVIHEHKTGKLIEFAIDAGARIANVSREDRLLLAKYARHIGLAFQIQDDILDVEGNTEALGKQVGSDALNDKSTYVFLTSLEEAKQMLHDEIEAARQALSQLSFEATLLEDLAGYIKTRQS